MSILVTGGAGYIGSFTVEALRLRGEPVVVLDNLSAGHRGALHPSVPLIVADLADGAGLRAALREHDVREVIHFAAFTSVPDSVARPAAYFRNNTVNTLGLLEAMAEAGAGRIVFSSTAAVYGEPESDPITEEHPKRPLNPYGAAKRMVEQMLEAFEAAHGLRHVALRYFNASGGAPDRGEDHFALLPAPSSKLTDPRLELAVRLLEDVEEVVHVWPRIVRPLVPSPRRLLQRLVVALLVQLDDPFDAHVATDVEPEVVAAEQQQKTRDAPVAVAERVNAEEVEIERGERDERRNRPLQRFIPGEHQLAHRTGRTTCGHRPEAHARSAVGVGLEDVDVLLLVLPGIASAAA